MKRAGGGGGNRLLVKAAGGGRRGQVNYQLQPLWPQDLRSHAFVTTQPCVQAQRARESRRLMERRTFLATSALAAASAPIARAAEKKAGRAGLADEALTDTNV